MRILLLALLVMAPAAHAQLAIGGQIGEPTGVSIKSGQGPGAFLAALGFDLNADRFSADAHYVLGQSRVSGARGLRTVYGPGVFVRSSGGDSDANAGLSAVLGVDVGLARRLEVYLHGLPRLQLLDETDVDFEAALGLRFIL